MSENPTIPQILERLAVVAPEWILHNKEEEMFYIPSTPWQANSLGVYGSDDIWILFGAACEKIEAEGWRMSAHTGSAHSKYRAELVVHNRIDQLYPANSDESITHAALQALLAALEEREKCEKCEKCKGDGSTYERISNHPLLSRGSRLVECPVCKGSGNKAKCNTCKDVGHVNYEPCPDCSGKTKD